jgi:hypothetical protein
VTSGTKITVQAEARPEPLPGGQAAGITRTCRHRTTGHNELCAQQRHHGHSPAPHFA